MTNETRSDVESLGYLLVQFFLIVVCIAVVAVSIYLPLLIHKTSMEHMVGHSISWWDAYWTH